MGAGAQPGLSAYDLRRIRAAAAVLQRAAPNLELEDASARVASVIETTEARIVRLDATVPGDLDADITRPPRRIAAHRLRVTLFERVGGAAIEVAQERPFSHRQRRMLACLIPALRDCVQRHCQLEHSLLSHGALVASLEEIPAPAFVVTASGAIRMANVAGTLLARSLGAKLGVALRDGLEGRTTALELELTPLDKDRRRVIAIVLPGRRATDPARLATMSARWRLTRRQSDVLRVLASGATNEAIARALRLTRSTVEIHLRAILARAGASSRAELVARFWSESEWPGRQ